MTTTRRKFQRQGNGRVGFTSIELLVSMLLASLLMVALIGIVGALNVQTDAIMESGFAPPWHLVLDQTLRHDFENARELELVGQSLVVRGHLAKHPQTGLATWEPAEAHYELVQFEDTSWLVRSEVTLLQGLAPTVRTEVVFCGATDFSFELNEAITRVHLNSPTETTLEGPQPVGARIRFAIYSQNNERPNYEYEHRHW